jgi:hypothetical protein
MNPNEKGYRRHIQDREEMPKYEVTQTGLKFKGNVKGIKFVLTQVASKAGQYTSQRYESEAGEHKHQSQGKERQDGGMVKQSGVLFLQSVADSQAEVNQSAEGKDFYNVEQDGIEVEGDTSECNFPVVSQRVR